MPRHPFLPRQTKEPFRYNSIEVCHADLDRYRAARNKFVEFRASGVDVPLVARRMGRKSPRLSIAERIGEVLLEEENLFLEASMRGRLRGREYKAAARVFAAVQHQTERGRMLKKERDGEEEAGGAARLDDEFVWVDKEARLRQHVGVESSIADGGDDDALDCGEDLIEGLDVEAAEAEGVVVGEVELESFFEAFEAGGGHGEGGKWEGVRVSGVGWGIYRGKMGQ